MLARSPLVAADHVGEGGGRRGGRRRGGSGDVGFRSSGGGQGGPVIEPGQEEALEEAPRVQAPGGETWWRLVDVGRMGGNSEKGRGRKKTVEKRQIRANNIQQETHLSERKKKQAKKYAQGKAMLTYNLRAGVLC